jgi:predicted DNA-binding transcriptional regulator AlpA
MTTVKPSTDRRRGTDRRKLGSQARRSYLTLAEFLEELDVPKSTFFRWKALGQAPRTYKLPNGQLRIRRTDFDAWMASREEPPAA